MFSLLPAVFDRITLRETLGKFSHNDLVLVFLKEFTDFDGPQMPGSSINEVNKLTILVKQLFGVVQKGVRVTRVILPKHLAAIIGHGSKHTAALFRAGYGYSRGASLRCQDFLNGYFMQKDGFILGDDSVTITLPRIPVSRVLLLKKRLVRLEKLGAHTGDEE